MVWQNEPKLAGRGLSLLASLNDQFRASWLAQLKRLLGHAGT
jgi:hypothetical protein